MAPGWGKVKAAVSVAGALTSRQKRRNRALQASANRMAIAEKGLKADPDNKKHQNIEILLDFLCGATWPPAPAPDQIICQLVEGQGIEAEKFNEEGAKIQPKLKNKIVSAATAMTDPIAVDWVVESTDGPTATGKVNACV